MSQVNYEKIGPNQYRLERTLQMQVEAEFYANDEILPMVTRDQSLQQLQQTAELPHLLSPVLGMPDMHQGYGIPVGGVMVSEKIVSAGCVGMDINCGVRLLRTGVQFDERLFDEQTLTELVALIENVIPVGLGGEYGRQHKRLDFTQVLVDGARHLVDQGYGEPEDVTFCEEEGAVGGANPDTLSQKSVSRAKKQVGTLGSGNHFLEIQRVSEIIDDDYAATLGLYEDEVCFMIHSGSRALGHQTCLDYTKRFQQANQADRPELVPVKNLASAMVNSPEGDDYLGAMNAAINFAFANRQMMTHKFREAFTEYMISKGEKPEVSVVYDVAHNSAKWEKHRGKLVLVHRKGATRALPPGHENNPTAYKNTGHPAFVPGSMGTPSYVLVGTKKAAETYYSVNHGAGRSMSRTEAKKRFGPEELEEQMRGMVANKPLTKIADEAPKAYKEVEQVIATLVEIGITKKVVQLSPMAVVKGD